MYQILVCDDQPDIVSALKIYLTPEGYEILEAATVWKLWIWCGKRTST